MSVKLRKKKLKDGKTSLYLDIYHNGQRFTETLKLYLSPNAPENKEVMKLAESIRAKRELEILHSEHGFIPAYKKRVNFVEYFKKVRDEREKQGIKMDIWNAVYVKLMEFTGGNIQISAANEKWLEQFQAFLLTRVSRNSAHIYFSKIIATLNEAVKKKLVLSNPASNVQRIKTQETKRDFLTVEELRKLAATPIRPPERYDVKRVFLFLCYTGLRISDAMKLTWGEIRDDRIVFRQKKTGGMEYIPLSATAMAILSDKPANVLPMPNVKVFRLPTRDYGNILLKRWAKDAGLDKKVTFHLARHTFATVALTMGADLYVVSKLLGHKDIQTTQIYAKVVGEKMREAVDLLPAIELFSE